MRRLVYYIATSLDGFIAREDGSIDDFPWTDSYLAELLVRYPETFPAPLRGEASRDDNRRFSAVLMGRKTYAQGEQHGLTSPYPTLDQYLFSRTLCASPDPAVTLVSSDAVAFVADLKRQEGSAIWLCGGGQLATALFAAGLVDELIVKINPTVFGTGIPLFAQEQVAPQLALEDTQVHDSGHVVVTYSVGESVG